MYREHEAAAEAVFRFRNPDPGTLDVVDLHGLLPVRCGRELQWAAGRADPARAQWEVESFLVDHMARVKEAPRPPDAVSVLVGVGRHRQAHHRFGKSRTQGQGVRGPRLGRDTAGSDGKGGIHPRGLASALPLCPNNNC